MKKLKMLPSLFLMVLCICALVVGVYAASPIGNKVSCSIQINSATPLDYEVSGVSYKIGGGTIWTDAGATIENGEITLDSSVLNFDGLSVVHVGQIKPIFVKIDITNNSTDQELGAYFASDAVTGEAVATDVLLLSGPNQYISAVYSSYSHAMASGNNGNIVSMYISIYPKKIPTTTQNMSLSVCLNLEEYNPNITSSSDTVEVGKIAKVSSTVSDLTGFTNLRNSKIVVLPTTITEIPANTLQTKDDGSYSNCTGITMPGIKTFGDAFGGGDYDIAASLTSINCFQLTNFSQAFSNGGPAILDLSSCSNNLSFYRASVSYIILGNVQTINEHTFWECTSLISITIPSSVTAIEADAFYNCNQDFVINFEGTRAEFESFAVYSTLPSGITISCSDYTWVK